MDGLSVEERARERESRAEQSRGAKSGLKLQSKVSAGARLKLTSLGQAQ